VPDELAALRSAIDRLPNEVTARLRAVAWRKSREVKDIARGLAARNDSPDRGRLNTGEPHLADSIVIIEDAEHKQFRVEPDTPWNPNLGLWIERGTVKMQARPFMRPAGDAVDPSYKREMMQAAESVANEMLGNL
jgi:HK97 gp10 family phage protein